MSKDRARMFSRKHRRYWIPITGGMILIGLINVLIGMCAYEPPGPPPERIVLNLPPPTVEPLPEGHVPLGEVPVAVMRAFAVAYPRNIPKVRTVPAPDQPITYELSFGRGSAARKVLYREDGTFVGEVPAR